MKHILLIISFITVWNSVLAYDFSSISPSGQTLYYEIINGTVEVTYASNSTSNPYPNGKPTGNLIIPSHITYNGHSYAVTSIGVCAFNTCNGLSSVIIPSTVTVIKNSAFFNCSGLTSVTIPISVTNIENGAFYNCSGLTSVTIPSNVTNIGISAFYNCSGLLEITSQSLVAPILGNNAFYGVSSAIPINIPCGSTASYQSVWSYFSNFIAPSVSFNIYLNAIDSAIGDVEILTGPSCDSTIVIAGLADYGYHFTNWNDGNTDNPRIITLTQDTSFTAYFEKNSYIVTVFSNNNTMGQATGGDTVLYLDSITISATSNYGYHFAHWQDNNTDNPRTIQVTQNKTYTAYFDYNQYAISLDVDTAIHGNVSGSGNYNYLSSRTITATANYGYHFTHWSDGNTSNPRIITLTQDTSFTAYFEKNSYTVTVLSNNNTMGQATGGDTVLYLDSITISATSYYGYHFTHWQDNNTDNPRTVQVTQNKTYTAYFDYDQFTLIVQSDNTTQGNVSGGGNYNYLSNRAITATPTYGHHFTYWNDGVTENPRTITLTQDTSFTAHFAPNQYTLTVNAGEHGTATGSGTYTFGDTITIQAFPDDHYHFTRWNDGNTDNPRQYRIEDNITLTAFFAIDTYTVVVMSSDIVRGMVEASGTEFVYGTPCTVTATAYTGYTFAGWSNGVIANPYTFAVISDVELTALFVEEGEEVYTVTVESADPTMGTVSGGGQALNGGTVIITAIPNEGYRFLTWNDGNTENPRTVTVTGNITYTAYFESTTQGIGDIDAAEIKIFASDGRIVVQGAEGMETKVYDLKGREVVKATRDGETPVLPTGVYLVKVGTLPARKVVVMR